MLVEYFIRGGWVMWPILGASIVALAVVLNRALYLLRTRGDALALKRDVLALIDAGRTDEARRRCAESRVPSGAVLEAGLSAWGLAQEEVERRLEQAAGERLEEAEANHSLLATMIAVLPMLGFLGTILGLIEAFGVWASAGANVTIEELAKGIEEAMITTAAGLVTSIPYVVVYNALAANTVRLARALNAAASDLAGRHRLRDQKPAEEVHEVDVSDDVPVVISLGGSR